MRRSITVACLCIRHESDKPISSPTNCDVEIRPSQRSRHEHRTSHVALSDAFLLRGTTRACLRVSRHGCIAIASLSASAVRVRVLEELDEERVPRLRVGCAIKEAACSRLLA